MQHSQLTFPIVEIAPSEKRLPCQRCGNTDVTRCGTLKRKLRDFEVEVQRYRCNRCGFTFRTYPSGVSRLRGSNRELAMMVFLLYLGVSCVNTVQAVNKLGGAAASQVIAWRAGKRAGLDQSSKQRVRTRVRWLEAEETSPSQVYNKEVVLKPIVRCDEIVGIDAWHSADRNLYPALKFLRSINAGTEVSVLD